jgi:hypothetical protein
MIMGLPDYYLNIEFATLNVIKNGQGIKCGFNLTFRDKSHDFIICIENQDNEGNNSPRFPDASGIHIISGTQGIP